MPADISTSVQRRGQWCQLIFIPVTVEWAVMPDDLPTSVLRRGQWCHLIFLPVYSGVGCGARWSSYQCKEEWTVMPADISTSVQWSGQWWQLVSIPVYRRKVSDASWYFYQCKEEMAVMPGLCQHNPSFLLTFFQPKWKNPQLSSCYRHFK
jgi:hypothetical protein